MIRIAVGLLLALVLTATAAAETRLALVIGNSDYPSGALPNPANDAKMMADTLSSLHFEVIRRLNADQTAMKRAIQEFGARLEKAGPNAVGLFYYAGHGIQLNGKNFLIPTTAQIEREGDVEIEAVSADWVLEQMRYARNGLNIVILDACRNNPFVRSMRSADHGLASMDAPAGIIIAYSTAPGSVAADGAGKDSPYTEALSRAMLSQHDPLEQVFKHVRVSVMNSTQGKQVPWEASSLTGDFYFAGPPAQAASPPPNPAGNGVASGDANRSGGVSGFISNLLGSSKPDPLAKTNPQTPPAASLPAPPKPATLKVASAGATVTGARALPLLKTLGIQVSDINEGGSYSLDDVRQLIEKSPRRVNEGNYPKQIEAAFELCQHHALAPCKRDWFGDEIIRTSTLEPFDLDQTPVSVASFRQFVAATHYSTTAEVRGLAYANSGDNHLVEVLGGNWRNGIKQRTVSDDNAVIGVSFQDAQSYCRFRNERLPTENEWEYVARGGPERRTFPWGEDERPALNPSLAQPKVSDGPPEGIGGRYRGLSGNVWQWVDSRYEGHQDRVLKGGSWLESNPAFLRPATRRGEVADRADDDTGFRCARSLPSWPDADQYLSQLK